MEVYCKINNIMLCGMIKVDLIKNDDIISDGKKYSQQSCGFIRPRGKIFYKNQLVFCKVLQSLVKNDCLFVDLLYIRDYNPQQDV